MTDDSTGLGQDDLHLRCSGTWPVDHRREVDQRVEALSQAVQLGASPETLARIASAAGRHLKAEQLEADLAHEEGRR